MTQQYAPHQQRVIDEKFELDEKLRNLNTFIESNTIFVNLPWEEKDRLREQYFVMRRYSKILEERIDAF